MDRAGVIADAVEHFGEHGYALIPAYLTAEELAPSQAELTLNFPSAEQYHASSDEEKERFAGSQFAGLQPFPYASAEWSLLGFSPAIVQLAESFLGTDAIRMYEAHNWAKYHGAIDYEQNLHCDYGNHTLVVPSNDARFREVEMFIYIHDVPEGHGPTRVVSRRDTADLPVFPIHLPRDENPAVYEREVSGAGPAGTVLAYTTQTFHRGTQMTTPGAGRFVLKASYRVVSDVWIDKLDLVNHLGRDWYAFVDRATPRQLELAGFPRRGHPFWDAHTWAVTCARYPDADLEAFRPA